MNHKKIFFKLTVEDDYPPVSEESIWGIDLDNHCFRIDNIPFYTKDVSYGDTISALEKDGALYYEKTIQSSGNSTIRIIFFDKEKVDGCMAHIAQMGCEYETFSSGFMAINIPATLDIEEVLDYLEYLHNQDIADYEHGKITQ